MKASIQTCGLTLEQHEADFKARTCVLVPGWRVKQVTPDTAAANLPFPLGCGETFTQSPSAVLTGFWGPKARSNWDQTSQVPACALEQDTKAPASLANQRERGLCHQCGCDCSDWSQLVLPVPV